MVGLVETVQISEMLKNGLFLINMMCREGQT
jgi:hypothetical protein